MPTLIAFFDANVLYPAELRNFLMRLANTGVFHAKWSDQVHEEWIEALLRNRPALTRQQLQRTRALMDLHAPGALVTHYQDLIAGLELPDPNDRHVLAAAIRCRADVIVSCNLKHFPSHCTQPFGIEAQHPDNFIVHLLEVAPSSVVAAANEHRQSLKSPTKTIDEYLESLEAQGLTQTVLQLRRSMSAA